MGTRPSLCLPETSMIVKLENWLLVPGGWLHLQLQSRFSALVADEGLRAVSKGASEQYQEEATVLSVEDSLLLGMEVTICWSDLLSRQVSCLPCIWIQDVVTKLPRFVWSSDYYPQLLFHVGTNDTGGGDLECGKCDYISLQVKAKGMGAQVASPWSCQGGGRA